MSLAWTTIAIIALLLPGVCFFIGLATYDRLSREIIRSGVVSEIALVIVGSIIFHTVAIVILSTFGFRLSHLLIPFTDYGHLPSGQNAKQIAPWLLPIAIYTILSAILGIGVGFIAAREIVSGRLRFFVKHKWIYDVVDIGRKRGIVTAYVMTAVIEDGRVLMYRGRLHEIFLGKEGNISYVVLKNCARFYMDLKHAALPTSKASELFGDNQQERTAWDYLLIEGPNISNILFEPSQISIRTTDTGTDKLRKEVLARKKAVKGRQASR